MKTFNPSILVLSLTAAAVAFGQSAPATQPPTPPETALATSTAPPAGSPTVVPQQIPPVPVVPPQTPPPPVQPLGIADQPPAAAPHVSSAAPEVSPATVRITIADAIRMALSEGTQAQLARSAEFRARYTEQQARSALLPRADVNLMRYTQSINLATYGFAQPGQPPVVGPFNVTDAQITAAMQLFNLASLRRLQASRSGVVASRYEVQTAENDVAAAVARLYVLVARADAQIASRQADMTLFQRLAGMAEDEFRAGTATRLDVAQSNVQLARARQAVLSARNDREGARLALLNAIGANQGSELVLADPLSAPTSIPPADVALATAREGRPELKQLAATERGAELAVQAARAGYVPTVGLDFEGDMSGTKSNDLHASRRIAAMASVPLFHGEIAANVGLAKVQLEDVRTRRTAAERDIEQEVRTSLMSVDNANERVAVAAETVKVAEEALTIAQDRRQAGYGSSVEVDRAEDAYRQAHEDLIAARADAAMAALSLQHATGLIRDLIPGKR